MLSAAILGLLGFSSCGDALGDEPDMYGTPVGEFEIKGAVTNESSAPVPDAEVQVIGRWVDDLGNESFSNDTIFVKTDSKGLYEKGIFGWYPFESVKVRCVAPDYDISSQIITLKYNGGSGWDYGTTSAIVDFKLTPQTAPQE